MGVASCSCCEIRLRPRRVLKSWQGRKLQRLVQMQCQEELVDGSRAHSRIGEFLCRPVAPRAEDPLFKRHRAREHGALQSIQIVTVSGKLRRLVIDASYPKR